MLSLRRLGVSTTCENCRTNHDDALSMVDGGEIPVLLHPSHYFSSTYHVSNSMVNPQVLDILLAPNL